MMKIWPVKHSPLLSQPERFIAGDELKSLIQKVTHNRSISTTKRVNFAAAGRRARHRYQRLGRVGVDARRRVVRYLAVLLPDRRRRNARHYRQLVCGPFCGRGNHQNVNTMSPFLTLAYRYEETRNPAGCRGWRAGRSGRCMRCRVPNTAACSTPGGRERAADVG